MRIRVGDEVAHDADAVDRHVDRVAVVLAAQVAGGDRAPGAGARVEVHLVGGARAAACPCRRRRPRPGARSAPTAVKRVRPPSTCRRRAGRRSAAAAYRSSSAPAAWTRVASSTVPCGIFAHQHQLLAVQVAQAVDVGFAHLQERAIGQVAEAAGQGPPPAALASRFKYLADGPLLQVNEPTSPAWASCTASSWCWCRKTPQGTVRAATRVQVAGALDDLYAAAAKLDKLGVDRRRRPAPRFSVWAPTARQAAVCVYDTGSTAARAPSTRCASTRPPAPGAPRVPGDLTGKYYSYAVDVPVDGAGIVRNLVTDPYSISLTTDSKRSYIARLDAPRLKPAGWDADAGAADRREPDRHGGLRAARARLLDQRRQRAGAPTAASTSPSPTRDSNGMRHLAALAKSGLTDVHLLPVYDFGSVPEAGCVAPQPVGRARRRGPAGAGDAHRRHRLLQLGLRPVPLQRAGRQLRHRPGATARAACSNSARWSQSLHKTRPARRHGRGVQPHLHRRPEREVGARPRRARLLPPPRRERRASNARPAATTRPPKTS